MSTQAPNNEDMPHIAVNAQYIKDFSFENPGAPGTLSGFEEAPQIDLALDLNIQKMPEDNYYEVEIAINAKAVIKKEVLFIVDLKYAGVFTLINIPEEQLEMLLAVHCPAIIFPYARKIIADATQDGGFQPLMIDPVDFGVLYNKKMTEGRES
ncbi:MAG: protein-export chaperone SecB [Rickettsiales bacterium]|nr:MAG: protein-export chaperone SecB [Rickettsiales bacterium]